MYLLAVLIGSEWSNIYGQQTDASKARPLCSLSRNSCELRDRKWRGQDWTRSDLRTVPTIVTAHTFCASRDTQVSYGWCLLIQG